MPGTGIYVDDDQFKQSSGDIWAQGALTSAAATGNAEGGGQQGQPPAPAPAPSPVADLASQGEAWAKGAIGGDWAQSALQSLTGQAGGGASPNGAASPQPPPAPSPPPAPTSAPADVQSGVDQALSAVPAEARNVVPQDIQQISSPPPSEQPGPAAAPTSDAVPAPAAAAAAPATTPGTSQMGAIDASSPEAFAKSFAPYAQYAAQKLGVDPSWVAAMAGSESNYGKAPGNELFGIKALPGQSSQNLATHEGENGGINVNQDFAAYQNPQQAVDAFVGLIQKHYPGAVGAQSLGDFVHGLKAGGYFTAGEGEYRNLLQGIADRVGPIVQGAGAAIASTPAVPAEGDTSGGRGAIAPVENQRQFETEAGLSTADAYSACGPVAAAAFAATYGRNPTPQEAIDLAKQVGWNPSQGMAGVSSEQALLDKMGIKTKLTQGVDWAAVERDATNGNPVIIDTPSHYFYVDGYDPKSGAVHVGNSGTVLRGGSEWMTPDQLQQHGARAALFADNPIAQGPSIAESAGNVSQAAQGALGGATDAVKGKAGDVWSAVQSVGSQALQTATGVLQNAGADVATNLQNPDTNFLSNPTSALLQDVLKPMAQQSAQDIATLNQPQTNAQALDPNSPGAQAATRLGMGIGLGLSGEPSVGASLMSDADKQAYYENLGQQYEQNDARINELQDQISSHQANPEVAVIRPPWAAGLSDPQLAQIARNNGTNAGSPAWWEQAGLLNRGSTEVQRSIQNLSASPTAAGVTDLRSELSSLQGMQAQIDREAGMIEAGGPLYNTSAGQAPDVGSLMNQDFAQRAGLNAPEQPPAVVGQPDTGAAPAAAVQASVQPMIPPQSSAQPVLPIRAGEPVNPSTIQAGQPVSALQPPAGPAPVPGAPPPLGPPPGAPPTNPAAAGGGNAGNVGGQTVLPGFGGQTGKPVSLLDVFKAYHVGNVVSGISTATHVAVNSIVAPAWSFSTRTAADLATGNVPRAAGGGIGFVSGLARSGDAVGQAIADSLANPNAIANRVSNPVGQGLARVWQAPGILHGAFQGFAQNAIQMSEYGRLAGEQATREGLTTGSAGWARRVGDLIDSPLPQWVGPTEAIAKRAVLRGDPGALGTTMQKIASVPFAGNTLFPVVRIASNSIAQGVEKSPLGLIGTGIDVARGLRGSGPYAGGNWGGTSVVSGLSERLINNIAGTALTAALLQKGMDGTITGDGPDNPAQRQTLMSQGWQPHSLYVPGKGYIDYHTLGPLAVSLSLVGAYGDAMNYAKVAPGASSQDAAQAIAGRMALSMANSLGSSTGLQTIGELWDTIHGGASAQATGAQFAGNVLGGFVPMSALVRGLTLAGDQYARKPETGNLQQIVQQNLPAGTPLVGGRDQVPIAQNVLGQPEANPYAGLGALIPRQARGAPNPILAAYSQTGVAISGPPAAVTWNGKTIQLTPDEKQQYQQVQGQIIQQRVGSLIASPGWQKMTQQTQARRLMEADTQARRTAERLIVRSIPPDQRVARGQGRGAAAAAGYLPGVMAQDQNTFNLGDSASLNQTTHSRLMAALGAQ